MKITDKNYNDIVDGVYNVDAGKVKRPWRDDKIFKSNGQTFRVLSAKDNTSNGMQAMAVAPVDKNGNVDYSHVVIAYAGTNKDDRLDIQTDIQSIGFGDRQVLSDLKTKTFRKSQFQTALSFAEEIEKTYPSAKITTAGHSLGESLAMYVALKRGYANVGYNGPDIHNLISKEEIKYMQEHPEQFRNFRHKYDVIGNITGNTTQTAIFPYIYPAKDNWGDKLEYHMLAPLNEYYTDEEYEFALRQMYRMMERNRIYTMATVILKEKNSLQTNYKEKVRESAEETKVAIGKIKSQMDTAIKGQVKKKLEEVTTEKLSQYDSIC